MAGRKLIAGNWKMNGTSADLDTIAAYREFAKSAPPPVEVALAVPHTLIFRAAAAAKDSPLRIGGEDCHRKASGAHTGCVSAPMLVDAGAVFCIVGHSERRQDQGETDADVRAKAEAALDAGLDIIVCVGESASQRDAGEAESIVGRQVDASVPGCDPARLTIAYEPVWAIGTGRTPSVRDVAAMHDFVRGRLKARFGEEGAGVLILYGGSVKPSNAAELLGASNVGGALVGGASLKTEDFKPIIDAVTLTT